MDNIRVLSGTEVRLRHQLGIHRLDRECFQGVYSKLSIYTPLWFIKNRQVYDVIVDARTHRVLAYSLIVPMTDEGYEMITQKNFPDLCVPPRCISKGDKPEELNLYLGAIVVSKTWPFGAVIAIKTFEKLYKAKMHYYLKNGVRFKRAFADVVTKEGAHLMTEYGLSFIKETTHGSRIFEGPFSMGIFF